MGARRKRSREWKTAGKTQFLAPAINTSSLDVCLFTRGRDACCVIFPPSLSLSLPPSRDRIILFRASPALSSSFCFFAIFTALSGYYTRRTRECLFERYIHSFPSARSFNFLRFSRPISFLSQPRQVEKGEEIGKQTLLTRFQLCKRESLLFYCPRGSTFSLYLRTRALCCCVCTVSCKPLSKGININNHASAYFPRR